MGIEQLGPHTRFLLGAALIPLGWAMLGAVGLRTACLFFDLLASRNHSRHPLPQPSVGKAMLISLLTCFACSGIQYHLERMARREGLSSNVLVPGIGLPMAYLVATAILAAVLPTSFGRAAWIVLIQAAIWTGVAGLVIAVVTLGYHAIGSP